MELSNCSLVIVLILNDILLLWIYMCCMDGSAYEIKFDFLFCFYLSYKINPNAIFFFIMKWRWWSQMMVTNVLNSPCFFICVSKFIITMTSSYSRTHFHKVHDMHFPRLIWKRDFRRITNACTINLLYDVSFFYWT